MAKERAIELQLIKPVIPGSSGAKGKIFLRHLFKEYFTSLNVGFYDPCCSDPATCPPISAAEGNGITCNPDGLFATGSEGIDTFYTADGQLEDDRTIDADGNSIFFENISAFTVSANSGGADEVLRLEEDYWFMGDASGDLNLGMAIEINGATRLATLGDVGNEVNETKIRVNDTTQEILLTGAFATLSANTINGNVTLPQYTGAGNRLVTASAAGLLEDTIQIITASASLDFPDTLGIESSDLTITATGAVLGDVVSLGVPHGSVLADSCFTAWVSAANTVTVRFNNYSSGNLNPPSGLFKVVVHKF